MIDFKACTPLNKIAEVEELEAQIKESFVEVFEFHLGKQLHELLCYGLPHLLDSEILKKFIAYSGLNVLRSEADNKRLSFLLKAWQVKNPKRGLHFLRTYLQMLYPNNFKISQLLQETSRDYPLALSDEWAAKQKNTPHWLTSRVRVEVTDWEEMGNQLYQYIPVLQSIVGARFVLMLSVLRELGSKSPTQLGVASGFSAFQLVSLSGECNPPSH